MKIIGRTWIACLLLAVVGCSGSCDKDKPYVPYSIDPSAITSPQGSAASSTAADEPPAPEAMRQRFKAVDAQRFKEHPKTASSSLGELRAPEGMRIELVLERDIDGDSKQDVVAWLRSDDGSRGELVRFGAARQGGPIRATTLAPLPADMTASTGCDPAAALQQVGPRTVVLSFTRACERGPTGRSAMRWIAVVVPSRNPAERLSMLVVEPTGPSELRISMDGLDRDGDGFDDLLVNVSVEEPGVVDGSVAASLYYFDRPAGLSRDPHEPSASLAAAAKRIAREAQRKEALAKVQSMGRRLRRLYQTLCAEGGAATIRVAGAALQCGARDSVLAAAEAELDAALRADAWAWGFGVQQRIAQIGGNHDTVARTRGRLEAVVQRVDADTYHLPFKPGTEPRVGVGWGGLAFDDSGALRIRTSTALLRFDPKGRVALPDAQGVPVAAWDTKVTDPGGNRQLLRLENPCDGGPVRAGFGAAGASEPSSWVALPVDAWTKGCARGAQAHEGRALSWDDQGLLLMTAGLPVRVANDLSSASEGREPTGRPHEGSGRSPDGGRWVVSTSLGVLVMGSGTQPQLWRCAGMSSYDQLQSCAVANGATALACVEGMRTRVMVP